MSDTAPDSGQPPVEINFGPAGEPDAPSPDDLANPYLSSIPEVDRNVVAKYIKGWQGEVTKRFQSIHDQYRPYKELGDPQELSQARALYNLMNERPEEVFRVLAESDLPEVQQYFQGPQQYQQSHQGEFQNPWEGEVPDDFAEMMVKQQEVIAALADKVLGFDSSRQEEQEAAELDNVLGQLHSQFGEFDEEAVLLKMYHGMDPVQAVQEWEQSIQQAIDGRQSIKPPPRVLGGNGSVAHGGVDPSKMGDKERRAYIAQQLQATIDNS